MINLNNIFVEWTLIVYQACQPSPTGVVPPAKPPVGVHYSGGQVCYSLNSKHRQVGVKRKELKKRTEDAILECQQARWMLEYKERLNGKWHLSSNCTLKTVYRYW